MYAGRLATVSSQPGWSDEEFLAQFDTEERGILTRISYQRDRFNYFPLRTIPEWLCHLSMDDLGAIDESCLDTVLNFTVAKERTSWADLLLPIFSTIRSRRLPVSSDDIWGTLAAHGFRKNKEKFKEHCDFGLRLLLLFNGRPPIRRRRMDPMSRGRYLTPSHEKWSGPSPTLTS